VEARDIFPKADNDTKPTYAVTYNRYDKQYEVYSILAVGKDYARNFVAKCDTLTQLAEIFIKLAKVENRNDR